MLATPYYESIDFDGVRRYFHDSANATDLAICIYNFPPAMSVRYDADRAAVLAKEVRSVKFIKDSSGDFGLFDSLVSGDSGVQVFARAELAQPP
jgi:4-hydroxy-tetrahydrodipicolinate synthase